MCSLPAADDTNGVNLRTAHYLLYVEALDAGETGRFLEAAYEQLKEFFKVEPDRKLQIKIYATKERYQKEAEKLRSVFAVNRKVRDLAGLYLRETACSYLYVQPGEYTTRRVLLHEVTHEYHDFIRPWSRIPSLDMCEEGIAEFFSWHNWDGKVLRLGIVPPIAKADHARAALRQLHNTVRFDLESIVAGDTEVDYPLAWGLVSFLIDRHRPKFDIWRQGLNNGVEPAVVWQKQFGPGMPELRHSLERWLQSNTAPWEVISGEWFPAGHFIEGHASEDDSSLAILTHTPSELTVALDSPSSNAVGGAVFGFRGAKNFHVVQQSTNGHWEVMHCTGNYFSKANHRIISPNGNTANVTIVPGEGQTILRIANDTVTVTNAVGHVGLWVKQGRLRFHCFSGTSSASSSASNSTQ